MRNGLVENTQHELYSFPSNDLVLCRNRPCEQEGSRQSWGQQNLMLPVTWLQVGGGRVSETADIYPTGREWPGAPSLWILRSWVDLFSQSLVLGKEKDENHSWTPQLPLGWRVHVKQCWFQMTTGNGHPTHPSQASLSFPSSFGNWVLRQQPLLIAVQAILAKGIQRVSNS